MSTLLAQSTEPASVAHAWWARWTAMRRAARGDHVGALHTSRDAAVLSRLGLHLAVLDATSDSARAQAGLRALAQAELGDPGPALELVSGKSRMREADRLRLLLAAGRWDPKSALAMSAQAPFPVHAALAARDEQWERCAEILSAAGSEPKGADDGFLRAAVAAHVSDHVQARQLTNAAFRLAGLDAPLASVSEQITLDAFLASGPPGSSDPELPEVSVIMPVKSMASSVESAAKSVLAQRGVRVELIVVDDASTDDTAARVAAMARHDPRVRLHRREISGGTYAARNIGLAAATAPHLAFNDADDWSHPERLRRQLQPLLADACVMATESRIVRLDLAGRFVAPRVYPLVRANRSSLVFRRNVLSRLGGFEEVAFGADEEFTARLVACFGVQALRRLATPLTVGLQTTSSLTGSSQTGITSREGTRARIVYREVWMSAHLQIASAALPDLPDWRILPR